MPDDRESDATGTRRRVGRLVLRELRRGGRLAQLRGLGLVYRLSVGPGAIRLSARPVRGGAGDPMAATVRRVSWWRPPTRAHAAALAEELARQLVAHLARWDDHLPF